MTWLLSKVQNLVWVGDIIGPLTSHEIHLTYTIGCGDSCRLSTMLEF